MKCIIVHYSEISTKGKNRAFFEKELMKNIETALDTKTYRRYGRIVCELPKTDNKQIIPILEKIPGIAYFSFAKKSKLNIEAIKEHSKSLLTQEDKTFKIISRRSNKDFPIKSRQINIQIGDYIVTKCGKKVDLHNPDIKIHIDICEKESFIYAKKYKGPGGLPVGSSGKVVCSLSGGIDSPVAASLMMKRGCKVILVHMHNSTLTEDGMLSKLDALAKELTKIQLKLKLYIVSFDEIQQTVIANIPSKLRMIVYRRFMMQVCCKIAQKENAKAIITGDSVGQVASQTLENIQCIYSSSKYPILAPLIGMNKEEIVNIAEKIGTYHHSILPYPDCCSFMIAKHPQTKATINEITLCENNITNKDELVNLACAKSKVKMFKFPA